uniref:Uncharacterized protein n=1 Tax=Ascaris lumbricoides TaxID=6252 RepID=A0A0M3HI13_ASCLU
MKVIDGNKDNGLPEVVMDISCWRYFLLGRLTTGAPVLRNVSAAEVATSVYMELPVHLPLLLVSVKLIDPNRPHAMPIMFP